MFRTFRGFRGFRGSPRFRRFRRLGGLGFGSSDSDCPKLVILLLEALVLEATFLGRLQESEDVFLTQA